MLAIEALTFSYPENGMGFRFDLDVAPGEIVALTGPSGSGKSTLFDLIAGFLTPEGGDITLSGRTILDRPPERRPVSLLFQSDNLFDHLTVAANMALGLPAGTPRGAREARIAEALATMELEGYGPRRAADLSGGQKQRVALARTLLRDRPVLLLDEPFSGLDEETTAPIRDAIADLVRARDWHAILVSHNAADIARLTRRGYRLEAGRTRPA